MQVDHTGHRSRVRVVAVLGAAVAVASLAACSSGGSSPTGDGSPVANVTGGATSTPSPSASPAVITTSAVSAAAISPTTPVTVSIDHGTLDSVVMRNAAGKQVTGAMSADDTTWKNTEDLGYGKTYSITATGKNADGAAVTKRSSVRTLTPGNQTAVYLDRTGDYALTNGATYGVALLPEMYFDENITGATARAAAEKAITVETSPHVDGAWAWQDDNRMLWRPDTHYWPANTKVTIKADIYGVKLGDGLYGQSDKQVSFTIGRKQLTIATDSAPTAVNKVRVYNAAGQVIRTMNTSMGEHTGTYANGKYINFYTLDGTYTVLQHENPASMSSDSYGLPASAPGGYAPEDIYYATKISIDGIYLHYLNTEYAQNSGQDVSHGCLNLNHPNAVWFYNHSIIGDPVVIHGKAQAPKIKVWQGGAWDVPWSVWQKGDLSNY